MYKTTEHKQAKVYYHGKKIEVDKNIVPLLKEMWKASINTDCSCEGNNVDNSVWIAFERQKDFKKFVSIVQFDLPYEIEERMRLGICTTDVYDGDESKWWLKKEDAWTHRVLVFTSKHAPSVGKYTIRDGDVIFRSQITFPKKHYQYVLKALRNYNRKRAKQ